MVPGVMLDLNQNKTQLNHVKRPAAFSDCLVQKHFLLKRETILRKLLLFEQRLPKTKVIAFNKHETMWHQISYPWNTMCISHSSLAPQSCQKTSSIFRVYKNIFLTQRDTERERERERERILSEFLLLEQPLPNTEVIAFNQK